MESSQKQEHKETQGRDVGCPTLFLLLIFLIIYPSVIILVFYPHTTIRPPKPGNPSELSNCSKQSNHSIHSHGYEARRARWRRARPPSGRPPRARHIHGWWRFTGGASAKPNSPKPSDSVKRDQNSQNIMSKPN